MRHMTHSSIATLVLFVVFIQPASMQAEPSFTTKKTFNANPYANSDILVSGSYHTLVPKGSVLNLPDRHKKRFVTKPSGNFILLKKFISKNYAWLSTQEVSFEQVKGEKTLAESLQKSIQQSGRVVIATLNKNPISVLKQPTAHSSK